ncbi:MAG: TIGR02147 family protein [Bdellovibrionales bacterium]|nr:TIGR02147 family protein [Bdellovibrionales bacterium]
MNPVIKNPDITTYTDAQQFLQDYYFYRKTLDEQFSYKNWAEELGIKNRSFLRLMTTGQRSISESTLQQMVGRMGLDNLGQQYFTHLVRKGNARNEKERTRYEQALKNLVRLHQNRIEITDTLSFLQSPEIPALQVLISYTDIQRSVSSLANLLERRESEVSQWLSTLRNLGLAEEGEDGQWQARAQSYQIKDQPGNESLKKYHAKTLQHAIQALETDKDSRRYRTLLMPLAPDQFAEVWAAINEFTVLQLEKYNGQEFSARRLYQMNVNLVPITKAES